MGSDVAAGNGLSLLIAGGGLVVCWLDCGRGWADGATDSCKTGAAIRGMEGITRCGKQRGYVSAVPPRNEFGGIRRKN
uniref:Uncharacterized protein n=1 Tax=Candidatus Methanogaster sp. ANME-2c ERB4 TaxID=2759911 RepID=A0A7G9Y130_9EURY|nr:hypothetical protein NEBFCOPL_00015 [Methanosarcinales archaeon ANME-2c ERB4]